MHPAVLTSCLCVASKDRQDRVRCLSRSAGTTPRSSTSRPKQTSCTFDGPPTTQPTREDSRYDTQVQNIQDFILPCLPVQQCLAFFLFFFCFWNIFYEAIKVVIQPGTAQPWTLFFFIVKMKLCRTRTILIYSFIFFSQCFRLISSKSESVNAIC